MKPLQICEGLAILCASTLFFATSYEGDIPENANEVLQHLEKNDSRSDRYSLNEDCSIPEERVEVGFVVTERESRRQDGGVAASQTLDSQNS